jgi:hypothetical protein
MVSTMMSLTSSQPLSHESALTTRPQLLATLIDFFTYYNQNFENNFPSEIFVGLP